MKKMLLVLPLFALSHLVTAQVKVAQLSLADIPKSVKYTGHIVDAVSFTDNDGEHLVITSETGIVPSKGPDSEGLRDASLYAYYYTKTGSELKLIWQTYDFAKDCGVDVTASYLPNSFSVTDLNKDGKAEVWLMYKTACRGDVSPAIMKIIMHEGLKKFAIRGESKSQVSPTEYAGGKYTFDEAFKAGPQVFRDYAVALWKKNLIETFK
nr:hypothetical protein [uncultured Mucilaginibacter sp.]